MYPDPALEELRRKLTGDSDAPGSMTLVVTFTDGGEQTYQNILVPTSGEAITYKDGRVEFESADRYNPLCYTLLGVRSIMSIAEVD